MRIKIFLFTLITITVFSACNKEDDFNYPEGTVGRSRITYFPILTMNGASTIVVPKGGTYTEPGVTAKEGANTIPVTTSGTVNTNVAGVYTLTYTAVNKDGYSASTRRTVAVYATDATAAANDFSGTYLRAATGVNAFWVKLAPGVYQVTNPGGAAAGTDLKVILFNSTGTTIKIPTQISSDGNTSGSTTETYNAAATPPNYSMVFINPGYGTGLRSFVKQ
jgi:hypothetical protein